MRFAAKPLNAILRSARRSTRRLRHDIPPAACSREHPPAYMDRQPVALSTKKAHEVMEAIADMHSRCRPCGSRLLDLNAIHCDPAF